MFRSHSRISNRVQSTHSFIWCATFLIYAYLEMLFGSCIFMFNHFIHSSYLLCSTTWTTSFQSIHKSQIKYTDYGVTYVFIYIFSLSPSVRWHWQKCSNSKCTTNTRYLWFEIEKIYNLIIFHIRYLLTSMTNFANLERLFIVDMSTDLRAERYVTVIWSKLMAEPILDELKR